MAEALGMSTSGRSSMQGVTLIELIVAMSIATLLMILVVPGFRDISASVKRSAVVNGISTSVLLARSESAKRGTAVSICPSSNGMSCREGAQPQWDRGWIVFVDDNNDGNSDSTDGNMVFNDDAGEELLRVFSFEHPIHSMSGSAGLERGILFRPGGFPQNAGQINYCETEGSFRERKTVELNVVGRIKVETRDGGCS